MAYRSAPIADDIIWRAAPQPEDASLADAVRETIASTRKHLLDFIRLDETPPPAAMTLPSGRAPRRFVHCWPPIPITSIGTRQPAT